MKDRICDLIRRVGPRNIVVATFLVLVLFVRLWVRHIAPFVTTEDSDAYVFAAEFMRNPSFPLGNHYLGYRQIGYPGLLAWFQATHHMPWYSLATFQIWISVANLFLIYRIARNMGLRTWAALIALVFFGFNIRDTIYSMVIAPETIVLFCVLLSFWMMSTDVRALAQGESLKRGWALRLVSQALVWGYLGMVKQLFLPGAVIAYGAIAVIGWSCRATLQSCGQSRDQSRRQSLGRYVAVYLTSGVVFAGLTLGGILYARHLIGSPALNPYCFPWATAVTYRYMDFDSPFEAEYKAKVRPLVHDAHDELHHLQYSYFLGDRKVNYPYAKGNPFFGDTQAAANRLYPHADAYESTCAVTKYSAAILKEALLHDGFDYVRRWLMPEIVRGLISTDRQDIGGQFRAMTARSFKDYPQQYPEANQPQYSQVNNHDLDYLYPEVNGKFFSSNIVFSALLFLFAIPYWRRRKNFPRAQRLFLVTMLVYCGFIFLAVGGLSWFYERYLIYVSFVIVLVALKLTDGYLQTTSSKKNWLLQ